MRKKILIILLNIFVLMVVLCACGDIESKMTILTQEDDETISIPVLFRINPETGVGEYADLINGFNEEYAGVYRIDVQWITETEQGYRERLKLLNALDQLPVIITDAAFSSEFYNVMMENNRFENLYPYMKDKEEWKELLEDAGDTEEVFFVPLKNGLFSSAGLFYNKSVLEEAGIDEIPDTWDEFLDCLERLDNKGITALALHGSGEYWSPMLISTAYMCSEEAGKEFLDIRFPDSYNNESMRDLLYCMSTLYDYTFTDAVEIDFNQAKERFLRKEAAFIANGYWMISEINVEEQKDIGFIAFPSDIMMSDNEMSSWAVVAGYDDDVIRGAVEFLMYRDKNALVDQDILTDLEREYIDIFTEVENVFPNYQLHWHEELLNDIFNEELPGFLKREVEMDEFIQRIEIKLEDNQ